MKRCLAVMLGLLLTVAWPTAAALAHPLGNFTVNRYSRIELTDTEIRVRYVLDMAEIPTFQELPLVDQGYASRKAAELAGGAHLSADGRDLRLQASEPQLSLLDGQGGLKTLRLAAWFTAPRAGSAIRYEDTNYRSRVGWSEIVLPGQTDVSHELTDYPSDLLSSPLDQHAAAFTAGVETGARSAGPSLPFKGPLDLLLGDTGIAKAKDAFAGLIDPAELSAAVVLFSLLAALVLGALHALSPGHGKTIVAAYLVGSRGTAWQAVVLGLTVTATHTAGVFALGLVTLFASKYVLPEQLYPWLSFSSGMLVVLIGLGLFVPRLRAALLQAHHHEAEAGHSHASHEHHAHGHDHDHDHDHTPDAARPSIRRVVALGISGGLLPCPSALVVLLSAVSLHRIGFGLVLICAFSLGLAGVLTAVGLLLVHAGSYVSRFKASARLLPALPMASAFVVMLAGAAISAQGLLQAGVI